MIDNIQAYSWQDRANKPVFSSSSYAVNPNMFGDSSPAEPPLTVQRVHAAVADLLRVLSMQLRVAVVVTKQAAVTQEATLQGARLVAKEAMMPVWQVRLSCLNLHVTYNLLKLLKLCIRCGLQ